jgi:hypothetical protein
MPALCLDLQFEITPFVFIHIVAYKTKLFVFMNIVGSFKLSTRSSFVFNNIVGSSCIF